jgi:hypothetical protein
MKDVLYALADSVLRLLLSFVHCTCMSEKNSFYIGIVSRDCKEELDNSKKF